jgi:hypothetical protein
LSLSYFLHFFFFFFLPQYSLRECTSSELILDDLPLLIRKTFLLLD